MLLKISLKKGFNLDNKDTLGKFERRLLKEIMNIMIPSNQEILAAGDKAKSLCDRPAWIKGIDHRVDSHTLGVRDLTRSPSAFLAAENAGGSADRLDLAEIHGMTSTQELILEKEFGLTEETLINPSGGCLASDTMMASGLIRISEVARRIISDQADRGLAHATSGPCLQQNLVCILEGE